MRRPNASSGGRGQGSAPIVCRLKVALRGEADRCIVQDVVPPHDSRSSLTVICKKQGPQVESPRPDQNE